jgi:SAM-dependent methyltransferase
VTEADQDRKLPGGVRYERSPDQKTELGVPGEDADRLLAAESDVAYRWAAGAVAGKHVLVAGCGRGHGAQILQEAGAATVVGADPDAASVEVATRLYGERIRFLSAETPALPLAAASFDVVVCVETPTAELDPEAAIAELGRVLAPGGLMLVSVPLTATPPAGPGGVAANGSAPASATLVDAISARFEHTAAFRRRLAIAATVAPADVPERAAIGDAEWLTGGEGEDRAVLIAASDAELPRLGSLASMVSFRDLRAQEETLEAWENRARRAEAEGSAKHWELVAAREAQRRLRMRLHQLEHRPLRVISRVLRGKPARLGAGPPLRASEIKPEHWD